MKISVKRRIVFNGKEYSNLEDLPKSARDAYARALAKAAGPGAEGVSVYSKIKFNGVEYGSTDEMTPDVREAYENAMASLHALGGVERVGSPGTGEAAGAGQPDGAGRPSSRGVFSASFNFSATSDSGSDAAPIEPSGLGFRGIFIALGLALLLLFLLILTGVVKIG